MTYYNKFKAFLVDLDGTLIGSNETLSLAVKNAIARLHSTLPVSIATGRESAEAIRFATELNLQTPQISDNGALILNPTDGAELWGSPLDTKTALSILRELHILKIPFIATHSNGAIRRFEDATHRKFTRVSALDLGESLADKLLSGLGSYLKVNAVKVFLPYNNLWAVDFTKSGINKGTAAITFARLQGIHTKQIIAAGDSYNDLSLFKTCGLSIAMGTAPKELKAIADHVTLSANEDGLALAIERFLLPKMSG